MPFEYAITLVLVSTESLAVSLFYSFCHRKGFKLLVIEYRDVIKGVHWHEQSLSLCLGAPPTAPLFLSKGGYCVNALIRFGCAQMILDCQSGIAQH